MTSPPWPEGYVPPVKSVMTPFPYSVDADDTVARAAIVMAEHEIRHLPVQADDQLVGVVSERDLRTLRLSLPDAGAMVNGTASSRKVAEVMTQPAYVVGLDTPLDSVLAELAARQIGCAVIVRDGRLAGIFTTVDACRLFALQLGYTSPDDDHVA